MSDRGRRWTITLCRTETEQDDWESWVSVPCVMGKDFEVQCGCESVEVAPVSELEQAREQQDELAKILESAVVAWQVEHGSDTERPAWFDEARSALLALASGAVLKGAPDAG